MYNLCSVVLTTLAAIGIASVVQALLPAER
jgi:hypothetical protein